MKLSNKLNLPEPIVEAIRNDSYNSGASDISATGLIEPVRIGALKARYGEELTEDVADNIHSLQGQSIHTILERAGGALEKQGYIVERRFYVDMTMPDGSKWTVSAQIDVLNTNNGTLQDYKVTSVYSVKDGPKEEYVKQLNIGRYCLHKGYELLNPDGFTYKAGVDDLSKTTKRQSTYTAEKLQIVAILRDWSKMEYKREVWDCQKKGFKPKYPEHQVKVLDVPVVSEDDVELYILERAIEHKKARALPEDQLPECTPEERWAKETKWAVMKPGNSRASKLFDTEEDAKISLKMYGAGAYVEQRPGESTRCASYCPVASKCSIAKKNGWVK